MSCLNFIPYIAKWHLLSLWLSLNSGPFLFFLQYLPANQLVILPTLVCFHKQLIFISLTPVWSDRQTVPLSQMLGCCEVCSKIPYCVIVWISGASDRFLHIPLCSMKQDFNILMHLKQFISSQFETAIYLGSWLWMEGSGKNGRFSGAQRSIENTFMKAWICFQKLGKVEKPWFRSQGLSMGCRQ